MIGQLQKLYDAINHETTGLGAGTPETDAEADFIEAAYECMSALLAVVKAADDYWHDQSEGNRYRLTKALCAVDGVEVPATQDDALFDIVAGR